MSESKLAGALIANETFTYDPYRQPNMFTIELHP